MKASCKIVMLVTILMLGVLMAVHPTYATVYANSETDFAGPPNDGHGNGWWYYEWPDPLGTAGTSPASAYDYTTVNLMADWSGGEWHGSFAGGKHYPYIGATLIMPAGPNWPEYNLWAVRRWVSTVGGSVYIYGHLAKNLDSYGNGVNGHIFVNGVEKWSLNIAAGDFIGVSYSINIPLAIGDNVDFALDCNGDVNSDESIFTATVDSNPPPVQPGGLTGKVTLSNFGGRMDLSPVEIVMSQGGVAKRTKVVTGVGSAGSVNYTFTDAAPGTYDVSFEAAHFLKKVVSQEIASGSATTLDVSLTSGDIDGDNHIGTPDFSILSGNFDQTGN